LIGTRLSASMVSGMAFTRTIICLSPSLASPEGSARFCALTAFNTSVGVMPRARNASGSRSTMIWRYLPPYGVGNVMPGIGASACLI